MVKYFLIVVVVVLMAIVVLNAAVNEMFTGRNKRINGVFEVKYSSNTTRILEYKINKKNQERNIIFSHRKLNWRKCRLQVKKQDFC